MDVPTIQLLEFGIFEMRSFKKKVSEHSATGFEYIDVDLKLLECTNKIPLRHGACFGMKYNFTRYLSHSFMCKILHPEMETPEGLGYTQTLFEKKHNVNMIHYDFILLEYKWQMIPGFWSFQICDHNNVFYEKEFEIFIENSVDVEKDEDYFYDL